MPLLKTLLTPLLLAVLADGQVSFPGKCPKQDVDESFNLDGHVGYWYYYMMWRTEEKPDVPCNMVYYERMGTSFKFKMFDRRTHKMVANGTYSPQIIQGKPSSVASFSRLGKGEDALSPPTYNILSTDSTGYAIIWWCKQNGPEKNLQGLIVLKRTLSGMGEESEKMIKKEMKKRNLTTEHLQKVKQDC